MELAVINDRQKPPDTQKETKMKTIDEKEKKAVLRQARDAVKLLTCPKSPKNSPARRREPPFTAMSLNCQKSEVWGILRTIGYSSHIIPLYNDLRHSN